MPEPILKVAMDEAELWSGVTPPNAAAREMAAQLDAIIKGFEALRGTMPFEDEPSSFEAALQATKE
ncbi:MAG: hypothetical protein ACKVP7_18485 [Hyphomicrobiaceae bacterium]